MRIGLVFSGGGGKGAYEIGVWKALKELGIDKFISSVSGASIGAINSAFFVQDDYEKAVEMWKSVRLDEVLPLNNKEMLKKGLVLTLGGHNMNIVKKYMGKMIQNGNVSKSGAIDVIDRYIDIDKIKSSGSNLYISCTEMPEFKCKYFNMGTYEEDIAKRILLASACIPTIFESEEILGSNYLDGGLSDNTPIEPVYNDGCDIIIVVLLNKNGHVDRSKFPNSSIIEIAPIEIEDDVIGGMLNFDEQARVKRIETGYRDTMNLIRPIMEIAAFKEMQERKAKEEIRVEVESKKNLLDIIKTKMFKRK